MDDVGDTNDEAALLRAYPEARVAVAWTELIVCRPAGDEPRTGWELIMGASPPVSGPEEVRGMLKKVLSEEVVEFGPQGSLVLVALSQMDHPQYLRYLAGKMGAY